MALTPKKKAFARCVSSGMCLSDSYREAYNAENMSDASIRVEASRLMADPEVSLMVERLQATADRAVVASTVSDKDLALTEFRRVIKEGESDNVKVRAAEALGKTIPGLFRGEEAPAPQQSSAEIRKELAEYLAEYGVTVDSLTDTAH